MKKFIISLSVALCLLFTTAKGQSQERKVIYIPAVPEWVPKEGYWVVESNKRTPRQSTIYFYNDDNVLVYKEKVEGSRLKVKKDKVKFHLKKVLETALAEWSRLQQPREDDGWVANELKNL